MRLRRFRVLGWQDSASLCRCADCTAKGGKARRLALLRDLEHSRKLRTELDTIRLKTAGTNQGHRPINYFETADGDSPYVVRLRPRGSAWVDRITEGRAVR